MKDLKSAFKAAMKSVDDTVYILGPVTERSLELLPELNDLSKMYKGPINVVICSPGGEEDVGFALFDALKGIPNTVNTYGYGSVYSIAALLMQAGDNRYMAPNASLMVHDGSIMISDALTLEKLTEMAKSYGESNKRYYSEIAKRSGLPLAKVIAYCKKETFFTAEEAIAVGLVDGIATGFVTANKKRTK